MQATPQGRSPSGLRTDLIVRGNACGRRRLRGTIRPPTPRSTCRVDGRPGHRRGSWPRSGTAARPQRRIFRSRRSGCRDLIRRGGRFHRIAPQCSWSFSAPWELSILTRSSAGQVSRLLRWRASAAEMRNKSCPIVTFQTERKGIWDSLPPMAVEIDLRGGAPAACLLATLRCLQHGKPEVKILRVRLCGAAGTDSGSRERRLSTAWVQTAAFLQQVPTTMELGPYRAGTAEFFWLLNWC